MTALLDVDQLRTFIAIAETGSFTRAADIVHKTQSAVSMQMKRLEERLDRSIFARDGRASKLTEDGERLLDYARRIVKLNVETIAAFSDELTGRVRLGVPDDYADRYLPEIMARFSRAYPAIELTVICEETICLLERIKANELDLAIITNCSGSMTAENFRQERLLDYARRIVKLNVETIAAFSDELTGRVRLGVPDDYADRYLPEIMARFSRGYPAVELSVICEPSVGLLERIDANEIDLAIVTNCESKRASETFRRERLLWVTSNRHSTHLEERMPLALGRPSCTWRRIAIERLEAIGRPFRVLYSSSNAGAVAAAVLAGLAVSVLPESGLRPGMRVLSASDGFPDLPSCRIGLVRNAHESSALADALAGHIISSLDNLSDAAQAAE